MRCLTCGRPLAKDTDPKTVPKETCSCTFGIIWAHTGKPESQIRHERDTTISQN